MRLIKRSLYASTNYFGYVTGIFLGIPKIIISCLSLKKIACFRFKNDIKLWLTQIDFAKANLDKERVSKIFTTMLQVHNKKPSKSD